MDYLLEFENHLNCYANFVEFEIREKFFAPFENKSFVEHVRYLNMIQEMVEEFVNHYYFNFLLSKKQNNSVI